MALSTKDRKLLSGLVTYTFAAHARMAWPLRAVLVAAAVALVEPPACPCVEPTPPLPQD